MKEWIVISLILGALGLLIWFYVAQINACERRGLDGIVVSGQVLCLPKGTRP
jgi:hypothetical protein